ncbi:MAG: DNA-binding protein [Cyanobium sp.]
MTSETPAQWVCTRLMAKQLSIHRVTLQRLKSAGYFRHGHHYRKANPTSPRSNTVWHQQRVLMRMQAD